MWLVQECPHRAVRVHKEVYRRSGYPEIYSKKKILIYSSDSIVGLLWCLLTSCASSGRSAVSSHSLDLGLSQGFVLSDGFALGAHPLEDSRSFGGKLALHADSLAVLVEQEGEGHAGKRQEGRDGAGPVVAQIFVHVGGEEGECSTKQGSKDRVGGKDRSGKNDICPWSAKFV